MRQIQEKQSIQSPNNNNNKKTLMTQVIKLILILKKVWCKNYLIMKILDTIKTMTKKLKINIYKIKNVEWVKECSELSEKLCVVVYNAQISFMLFFWEGGG